MDTLTVASIVGAAAAGAGFAWLAARRHFGAQLDELRGQVDKADKARQVATQNAQQMRKQIDQLQRDSAAGPASRGAAATAAVAARAPDDALARALRAKAAEAMLDAAASAEAPAAPAHGFADTQPMSTIPARL